MIRADEFKGAYVNSVMPYSVVKKSNVGGTKELLRFASLNRVKTFNFVSTVGVFGDRSVAIKEDALLERQMPFLPFMSGYSQSKWVAENAVREAEQRGLPIRIFRPGTSACMFGYT